MIRTTAMTLILAGAIATLGCRRDAEPPPLSIDAGGATLAPVIVPVAPMDRSIIASAPPLPEPGARPEERPAEQPADDNKAAVEEPPAEEMPPAENAEAAEEPKVAEPPPAEPAPKPADNAAANPPPKPERKRDEVDDVYSGPGMLRAR